MGDVPAEERLSFPPVQKVGAFQQQRRREHVAGDSGQDVDSSTHLTSKNKIT